jgi:hypothetical protein
MFGSVIQSNDAATKIQPPYAYSTPLLSDRGIKFVIVSLALAMIIIPKQISNPSNPAIKHAVNPFARF